MTAKKTAAPAKPAVKASQAAPRPPAPKTTPKAAPAKAAAP